MSGIKHPEVDEEELKFYGYEKCYDYCSAYCSSYKIGKCHKCAFYKEHKERRKVYDLKVNKLEKIRNYIIDNVMREPAYMFSEEIRGTTDDDIDLVDIIASLYEELHHEVMGEPYDYMFHWANKCGSRVRSDLFEKGVFDV